MAASTLSEDVLAQAINSRWPKRSVSGHRSLIVAAARKRGLVAEKGDKKTLFRRKGVLVGGLNGMMPHTTTWLAYRVCKSKHETRARLEAEGIAVPRGQVFLPDDERAAARWAAGCDGHVVIKPAALEGGKGVIANLPVSEFADGWRACREAMAHAGKKHQPMIVEEHVAGLEARCMVVDGQLVAVTARVPAHVDGDGRMTVLALIEEKNRLRRRNPNLRGKLIKVDALTERFLQGEGLSLEDVPGEGERVWLSAATNVSRGGDSVDLTDQLPARVAALAEAAIQAIPGMDTGGVDVLVPDMASGAGAVVLEVNASANIGIHHYPWRGQPRDVAAAWVEALYL